MIACDLKPNFSNNSLTSDLLQVPPQVEAINVETNRGEKGLSFSV